MTAYKNIITGPELPPINGKSPEYLCLIFHGYGADGYNLFDICRPIAAEFNNVQFIVPNAPNVCEVSPDGFQWFSLMDRREQTMYNNMKSIENMMHDYIDNQLKRFDLIEDNLILAGFSQGAMMAMHLALRRTEKPLAVGAFSGKLLGSYEDIEQEMKSKPNMFLIHGEDDQVVPFSEFISASKNLDKLGVSSKTKSIKRLGHSIDHTGLDFFINQLKQII